MIDQSVVADGTLRFWRKRTLADERSFRRRYKFADLRAQDPDLATRLFEQEALFVEACVKGTYRDIEVHGSALCRGWKAAWEAMGGL